MKITNEGESSFKLPFKVYLHKLGYLVQNEDGNYIAMNERMLKRRLKQRGIDNERANCLLEKISQNHYVDLCVEVAGYPVGLHINNNVRVLVPKGMPIIPAVKGDWSTSRKLLTNMFGEEQLKYFLTWWKAARGRLLTRHWIPLQSIVLAGPPGCGKTTLLWLLGKSLGRITSPFEYITGKTHFNEDLAGAELLAMDDEHSSALEQKDQNNLSAFLKWIAVKSDHRVAPKNQKAQRLNIITTAMICTNLEPQNLKIIPLPMDNDMRNRQHIFKCEKHEMPMPVTSPEEKKAFYAQLERDLPAIHHHLDEEYQMPKAIADLPDERFPCKAWQHPEIISLIMKGSPVMKFRDIVLSVLKKEGWYFANDLAVKFAANDHLKRSVRSLAKDLQMIGNNLAKWKDLCPTEIREQKKVKGINKWRIVPPPEESDY